MNNKKPCYLSRAFVLDARVAVVFQDDQRTTEINDQRCAERANSQNNSQNADNGGVNIEILTNAAANTAQLFVGTGKIQFFSHHK